MNGITVMTQWQLFVLVALGVLGGMGISALIFLTHRGKERPDFAAMAMYQVPGSWGVRELWFKFQLNALILLAQKHEVVLTIDLVHSMPPVTGKYEMVPDARPSRAELNRRYEEQRMALNRRHEAEQRVWRIQSPKTEAPAARDSALIALRGWEPTTRENVGRFGGGRYG